MNRENDAHDAQEPPLKRSPQCPECGYDLTGTESPFCPECGTPKLWQKISLLEPTDFSKACTLLAREQVKHRPVEALPQLGAVSGSRFIANEIWIVPHDADRVLRLLEEADIAVPMPIVDRSEASCPQCNSALDPESEAVCPHCGLTFRWIEIEDGVSGETPLDGAAPRTSQRNEQWTPQRWDVVIPIALGSIMAFGGIVVAAARIPNQNSTMVQTDGWIGLLLTLIGVILVRVGFLRSRHKRHLTTNTPPTEGISAEADVDVDADWQGIRADSRSSLPRRLQRLAPWVVASVLAGVATPVVMMVLAPIGSMSLLLLAPLLAFVLLVIVFRLVRGRDATHR